MGSHHKKNIRKIKEIIFLFIVRQTEMPFFGKKKTVEQQMREQDREMRRVNRGLERDRGQLDKEEKKLEAEIKKMAKQGNKEACGVLAKQLVNLRKQKTRSYAAGAKMNSIQAQTKIMHTNTKMAQSMGKTTKTMQAINKTMDPQKVAKTMQQFERENMKMGMSEELMNDAIEAAFEGSDEEEETNAVIDKVLDEIGIDSIGQMSRAPQVNSRGPAQADTVTDDEIEKQLKALGL